MCACARHDRYCVRASDSEILVREEDYESLSRSIRVLNFSVYRGTVSSFYMMIIGLKDFSFSTYSARYRADKGASPALNSALIFSVGLGVGYFFIVLLLVAQSLGLQQSALAFNLAWRLVLI